MEELKTKLILDINDSKLHIEGVYYIVKDLYRDVEVAYNNYLKQKAEETKKNQESKEEKEDNKKEK